MKSVDIFLSMFFVLCTCTYAMERKVVHSGMPFWGANGKPAIKHRAPATQSPIINSHAPASPITGGQSTQEDKDLAAAIKASLQSILSASGTLPLPKSLQDLHNATIIHYVVTQQGANQCGSRSVANALAVQEIINADEPLSSANIRNHAARYDHILINRVIEDDVVANLARNHNLYNAHVLAKSPKEQIGEHFPYVVYSLETQSHSLEELVDSMLIETTLTAHLICNTGGHWVLISIIKQEGKKPLILYMDSGNGQLKDNTPATSFILYLYEHCIE